MRELPDRPGAFACAIRLRPWFQLDNAAVASICRLMSILHAADTT